MALCHEGEVRNGQFSCASQEELCFLEFASSVGARFLGMTHEGPDKYYNLECEGKVVRYRILVLFSFDY
jgi:hypothetical protein